MATALGREEGFSTVGEKTLISRGTYPPSCRPPQSERVLTLAAHSALPPLSATLCQSVSSTRNPNADHPQPTFHPRYRIRLRQPVFAPSSSRKAERVENEGEKEEIPRIYSSSSHTFFVLIPYSSRSCLFCIPFFFSANREASRERSASVAK